jgi:DNA-directed RNA polymerase specialized sigma24 family protein
MATATRCTLTHHAQDAEDFVQETLASVAATRSAPIRTVMSRLHRGRTALRSQLMADAS